MKPSPSLLAVGICLHLAAAPLLAEDILTIANTFDCHFFGSGESGGGYSSYLNWSAEHKASISRALTAWSNTITNTPGRNLSVGLFWGNYGSGSRTLGSATSPIYFGYSSLTKGNLQVYTVAEDVWRRGSTTAYTASDGTAVYDIIINFNYEYADSFYYGTETNVNIGTKYDFQSVVMHEVAHALGVTTTSESNGTFGTYTNQFTNKDFVVYTSFDALMRDASGNSLVEKATLALESTGTATGFTVGEAVHLEGTSLGVYNPSTWQSGSSMAHVTGDSNALMNYAISNNTFHRNMTESELELMTAMGWSVSASDAIPEPTTATLSLAGLAALLMRRRRRL